MNQNEADDMSIGKQGMIDKIFALDTLAITPDNANFYFQCNESEINPNLQSCLLTSEYEWYYKVKLDKETLSIIREAIEVNNLFLYFNCVEATINNNKLYEMYDGCELAIFSKNFSIPQWFVEKHLPQQMYSISKEW